MGLDDDEWCLAFQDTGWGGEEEKEEEEEGKKERQCGIYWPDAKTSRAYLLCGLRILTVTVDVRPHFGRDVKPVARATTKNNVNFALRHTWQILHLFHFKITSLHRVHTFTNVQITMTGSIRLSALAHHVSTVSENDTEPELSTPATPKYHALLKNAETNGSNIEIGPPHISGDLIRPIHFYKPPRYGSPPRFLVAHPNGSGIRNFGTSPVNVTVRDIRNKEHRFHLALHSFKPLRHLPLLPYPLNLKDPAIVELVHNSTKEIIKNHVNSPNEITLFSTTILKACNKVGAPSPKISHPMQVDQTPGAAILRAKHHLTQNIAEQVESGALSVRVIVVYRPVLPSHKRITDHQLCLAESLSINDDNLTPIEHVYPDRVGQTYAVKYSSGQKFWYWSDVDSSEGIVVQVYDSLLGFDNKGHERMIRGATGFFKVMPKEWDEGKEAEWLVIRALVVA
ncbi:hypothetical protein TWF694_005298 [Orbilia ellipsospora]|uniref:Uncharacterized protein n=1 Tax=Orbilia ellipsospora TaxID=2528407 RepID=A0AAV9WU12_9PEZI